MNEEESPAKSVVDNTIESNNSSIGKSNSKRKLKNSCETQHNVSSTFGNMDDLDSNNNQINLEKTTSTQTPLKLKSSLKSSDKGTSVSSTTTGLTTLNSSFCGSESSSQENILKKRTDNFVIRGIESQGGSVESQHQPPSRDKKVKMRNGIEKMKKKESSFESALVNSNYNIEYGLSNSCDDDDLEDTAMVEQQMRYGVGTSSFSRSRQKKFSKTFTQLPEEEILLQRYSCALVGDILLQGHLYITENYYAFYSNVFGYVTKLQIPINSVLHVTKEKTAKFIPNAVGLSMLHEKHVFTSLLSRDSTFKFMQFVWKRVMRKMILPKTTPLISITGTTKNLMLTNSNDNTSLQGGGGISISTPSTKNGSKKGGINGSVKQGVVVDSECLSPTISDEFYDTKFDDNMKEEDDDQSSDENDIDEEYDGKNNTRRLSENEIQKNKQIIEVSKSRHATADDMSVGETTDLDIDTDDSTECDEDIDDSTTHITYTAGKTATLSPSSTYHTNVKDRCCCGGMRKRHLMFASTNTLNKRLKYDKRVARLNKCDCRFGFCPSNESSVCHAMRCLNNMKCCNPTFCQCFQHQHIIPPRSHQKHSPPCHLDEHDRLFHYHQPAHSSFSVAKFFLVACFFIALVTFFVVSYRIHDVQSQILSSDKVASKNIFHHQNVGEGKDPSLGETKPYELNALYEMVTNDPEMLKKLKEICHHEKDPLVVEST